MLLFSVPRWYAEPMTGIFISYRRDDSSGFAGRLEDDLSECFGDASVFRDREIPAGADFAEHLSEQLDDADVALVVIGRKWLDAQDRGGMRRLDQPGDWVRREIEHVLVRDCLVIPVLVDGATMPWPEQLPDSLDALAGRQAVSLSDLRWRQDVEGLADQLARQVPSLARARLAATPSTGRGLGDLIEERLGRDIGSSRPRGHVGLALGRWAAGRLGKVFNTVIALVVIYLLIRSLGGANANLMLDKVINTSIEHAKTIF